MTVSTGRQPGLAGLARSVIRAALDLVYPRVCAVCGKPPGHLGGHVCWDCRAQIEVVAEPYCDLCGDPVEGAVEHAYVCGACRQEPPRFDRARSAARYRPPLDAALQRFKYGRVAALASDLSPLLVACVRAHYGRVQFDGVTYVPLYPTRERDRTYNQAWLLAKQASAALELGRVATCLRRVRPTPSQTGFTARERRANVRGAFAPVAPEWIEGRALLLVDDVMTTGATVNECARVLKEAGAAGVYVATVARG
jgi:ComF family protein